MNCLKCGREIDGSEVFCPGCLENMAHSPVKPGTPVILPVRQPKERKVPAKPQPKPEATIAALNKTIRRLRLTVAILCVLLALTVGALSFFLYRSYTEVDIGSNYNTAEPSEPAG